MGKSIVRVVIPDSHGHSIDWAAAKACVADIKRLSPHEIVGLGDHIDAGSTFSTHPSNYLEELEESYEGDCKAGNKFWDMVQVAAPRADFDILEGNHEAHVERWATRVFKHKKDANGFLNAYGPYNKLEYKRRGFRYYRRAQHHMGLSVNGTIKKGKCFFTHGFTHGKNAAHAHLAKVGSSVVFGHGHHSVSVIGRSVVSEAFGAWSPGTLAKLQPLYLHTDPSGWSHGYAIQLVNPSGRFLHINVPIVKGESLLANFTDIL